MFTLVICSILLSFSNCAVIREARTLPREWDVGVHNDLRNKIPTPASLYSDKSTAKPFDWWNKISTSRSHYWNKTPTKFNAEASDWNKSAKLFKWGKSTVKPLDRNRSTAKPFNWGKSTVKPFIIFNITVKPFDWNRFTPKPFEWEKSTAKPFDWNRFTPKPFEWEKSTAKPFDWNRFTPKPFEWEKATAKPPFDWNRITIDWDWNRFTVKPFDWDKITFPTMDYNYYHRETDNTSLKVAIFVPLTIGIIIVTICKFFLCKGRSSSSSNTSTPILHPPPRRTIPPPPPPQNRRGQNITLRTEELLSTAPTVHSRGTSNTSNVTDKPPGYSDVIMGDFGLRNSFPEVHPIIPETPPPQYDEKNVMRY